MGSGARTSPGRTSLALHRRAPQRFRGPSIHRQLFAARKLPQPGAHLAQGTRPLIVKLAILVLLTVAFLLMYRWLLDYLQRRGP